MANHFLNADVLDSKSKNIASAAVVLALASAASGFLGILRDWLLANRFGAGADLDVYYAAFRIPDFIYNVLVFGGITVAFLPLFSDYYLKDNDHGWRFANNTLNVFFGLLVALSVIFFIFTPQLMALVAPGFSSDQLAKTVFLSRMMFLSPIIFGAASIFSGVLQYFKKFLAYSIAPLLYNMGIILGIVFLAPQLGITGVAIGVIVGALFYLFVQLIPARHCGFHWQPVFNLREPSLGRVFGLMLPRTAGIAANQINLIAPTFIGSTLAAGSITVFNLASNLCSLPAGIIGVSFATAAFASFSKYFAQGQVQNLAQKFSETYRQIGYLAVPAALLLFVLRRPMVDFLYYHGQFTQTDALLTAATLGVFCLGIYFTAMMPVMFRLFFSLRDTVTPTSTTVVSVIANIFMNLLFVDALKSGIWADAARRVFGLQGIADISVLGLALAYGVANALQFTLLVFLFYRKNPELARTKEIVLSFLKTF
ncbi:MAG: murein biosynthesis integral membrane protein MurJ, partial [Candidatus Paceibacterota bacterium]